MKHNPYGSSCGTSMVVVPSLVRGSTGKLGTAGTRLSDTKSGKAPKRTRTKEELETMARHPSSRRQMPTGTPEQPTCTCKKCKVGESIIEELDSLVLMLKDISHQRVQANLREEENRTVAGRRTRIEHLRLMGDSDS